MSKKSSEGSKIFGFSGVKIFREYVSKKSSEGSKVFGFSGVKIFRDLRETGPRPGLSPEISLFDNVESLFQLLISNLQRFQVIIYSYGQAWGEAM